MKKLLMSLVCLFALVALVACGQTEKPEQPKPVVKTYYGEYSETFGKGGDLYTTAVKVTVTDGVISKVEFTEESNHYTKGSSKWVETTWTDEEADVLASFEGKTVEEVLTAGAVADTKSQEGSVGMIVAGATVTSNRVHNAIVDALTPVTYKLGMGVVVAEEGEASNGALLVSSTVATVVLDTEGKIVLCRLDALQNKIKVEDGVAVSNNTTSKAELGDNYNMSKFGANMDWNGDGRVLEWYLQAQAFENFVVGMTKEEVAAMTTQVVEGSGYVISDNEDLLAAGCTIQIDEFKAAVVKACNDEFAVEFSTAEEIKLGVAINAELNAGDTKAATETASGVAALYSEYACTVVADGVILATLNDAIQPKLAFDIDGELGELTFEATKRELKEDYHMALFGASMDWNGDGKVLEWYVQSAEFSKFVAGKTAEEVAAMATKEVPGKGYIISADDALLTAGCTIQITGLKAVVVDAVANAR